MKVKLSEAAHSMWQKKYHDRVGTIVNGQWPHDRLYSVQWEGNKTRVTIAKHFLKPADE
jgi:hypothetical protein